MLALLDVVILVLILVFVYQIVKRFVVPALPSRAGLGTAQQQQREAENALARAQTEAETARIAAEAARIRAETPTQDTQNGQ